MPPATYLVFGDLHGLVLPAFRLAQAWSREHDVALAGLLQVGDLGDFPDPSRFDKATKRHAEKDSLEGGVRLVARPSHEADTVFADELCPGALWFTAGNHEDYDLLKEWERGAGRAADSFAVDAYGKLRCVRDGHVAELPGGLRVGALWGIDDRAPRARERIPPRARISHRGTMALSGDVGPGIEEEQLRAPAADGGAVLGGLVGVANTMNEEHQDEGEVEPARRRTKEGS